MTNRSDITFAYRHARRVIPSRADGEGPHIFNRSYAYGRAGEINTAVLVGPFGNQWHAETRNSMRDPSFHSG